MVTQITFRADKELKNRALQKAKTEGIPLKSMLVLAMKAYVEGKMVLGFLSNEEPEVEEIVFYNESLNKKTKKLEKLLS